jgi:hypothetical protein
MNNRNRAQNPRLLHRGLFFLILAGAAALRLPGLRDEPWLDEVWSIGLARKAASAFDVFFRLRHDNNNVLNTLYLRLVPEGPGWQRYRLLAFVCGLLTVALLGWDDEDPARGLLAAALAAVSTQMVLYGTEARGYALAALAAVACFRLLQPGVPRTRARAAAFSACALLGLFSHPTFAYVFAALAALSAAALPRTTRIRGLLVLFGPPAAVFGLVALFQFPMAMGGANAVPLRVVLLRTLALWSGTPFSGTAAFTGGLALLALVGWEFARVRRERPAEFVFFAALFAGALALAAAFPFPFERHFFLCLPFVLLLLAGALRRLFRRPGGYGLLAALAGSFLIVGNLSRDRAVAQDGRGRYAEAVARMARDTPGPEITVSSDHDARNEMMLDFYAASLPPGKRLVYVPSPERARHLPDWFLLHTFETDRRAAPIAVTIEGATRYELTDVYPYGGLSGWTWMLYRRPTK